MGISTDFVETSTISTPVGVVPSASVWDSAEWDVDVWGGAETTSAVWGSSFGLGYCAAVRMSTLSTGVSIKVNAFDLTMQPGAMGI